MESSGSSRAGLARGGALSFVGSATSAALGFVVVIVLGRALGAQGAGVVTQATGVFTIIMALAKLGLDSTSIYLLPRLLVDDPGSVRRAVRLMTWLCLGVGTAAALLVWALAPALWEAGTDGVAVSVRALAPFIPLAAATVVLGAVLRALGSVREYVVISNITVPTLRLPLVWVSGVAVGSAVATAVAWAAPFLVALALAAVLLRPRLARVEAAAGSAPSGEGRSADQLGHDILAFALPRTLTAGLEQVLIWVDVLIVGWLAGDAGAGVYGGASRFIQAGLLVDAALRVVVSPLFSTYVHQTRLRELQDLYATATAWLVLFGTPAYAVLLVFSPTVLGLMGEEFVAGEYALQLLCVGAILTFLAGNIHSLLLMSGRAGWAAVNKAVVLTVNVVGNVLLVPRWGIAAAAAVWSVCMLLDAVLALLQVRHFIGVRPSPRESLEALAIVVGTVLVPCALIRVLVGTSWLAVGIAAAVCLPLYCAAVAWRRRQVHLDGLVGAVRRKSQG